jgi:hypothetical protein
MLGKFIAALVRIAAMQALRSPACNANCTYATTHALLLPPCGACRSSGVAPNTRTSKVWTQRAQQQCIQRDLILT